MSVKLVYAIGLLVFEGLLSVILATPGRFYSPTGVFKFTDLDVDLKTRISLVVRVQGCKDGHVALTDQQGSFTNNHYYVIVLGGSIATDSNIAISLRRNISGASLGKAASVSILNCSNPLWFWVTWDNASIRAGIGSKPGQFQMVSYNDPTPLEIVGAGVAIYTTPVTYSIYDSYRRIDSSSRVMSQGFSKVADNSFLLDTCLERINTRNCNYLLCSQMCLGNTLCTAFNLRRIQSGFIAECLCELQDRVPWPAEDFLSEEGSSYWVLN